jgi:hypothetical protein
MAKSVGNSMASMQQGRSGEIGQVSRGGESAASTPSSSSSISSKFHERPGGGEISQITNKGEGMMKG